MHMKDKEAYQIIRKAVLEAVEIEKGPFNIFGRGSEPRVTLDRRLAAVLRGLDIPRIYISGYGANYYYPTRVLETAQKLLEGKLERSRYTLIIGQQSAWLLDKVEYKELAERLSAMH